MAENINALILPIGADPSQFEKSIKEVKDALKALQKEIAAKPFNLITDQEISQLKGLESTLARLQTSVQNTGAALSNSVGPTKNATSALTSLSLVAQDAPFGFIGIQNNLPALIQSFGQLKQEAGGVQGAFSQLSSALIGPAGLFLAFSAATAAVTLAVKEYGSLTNAFDALFTSTSQATIAQRNYNKELKEGGKNLGSELSKVDLLSKGIANENLSREERLNYFFQAKKELPDLLAGLDEENILTKNGIKLLLANASARSKFLDLQVKQQAIGKVLNENYSDELDVQSKLLLEEKKRDKALKVINESQALLNKTTDPKLLKIYGASLKQARKEFDFSLIAISKLNDELGKLQIVQSDYSGDLDGIVKGQGEYEKGVTRLTDALAKQRAAEKEAQKNALKNKFILGLEPQDLDAAFNLESIISSITKYGNALLDTNKSVEERKNALKELVAINPQVFSGLTLEKSGLLANKNTLEEYIRSLQVLLKSRKDDARASQINTEFRNAELKKQDEAIKSDNDRAESIAKVNTAQDFFIKSLTEFLQKNNSLIAQQKEIQDINEGVIDILNKGLNVKGTYEKAIKDLLNFEEYQKGAIDRIARNFRFLQNPLEDLFGTVLEDGIANWQAFGDAVVSEIKKIAAALLAKSFIQLLGNLLAPGVGSLLGAGFSGISDDALGEFLGNGSKVNFSGIQGGGMQMAGAVNLTLRGSDLVGSINRTNTTINRVG
jgi:hypothetical protein